MSYTSDLVAKYRTETKLKYGTWIPKDDMLELVRLDPLQNQHPHCGFWWATEVLKSRDYQFVSGEILGRMLDRIEGISKLVRWEVKDFTDGWIPFQDEARARQEAQQTGALIRPVYE